jgi:hypothetical protein
MSLLCSSHRGDLGASHVAEWELLWSKSTYALQAARGLVPGQQVLSTILFSVLAERAATCVAHRFTEGLQMMHSTSKKRHSF